MLLTDKWRVAAVTALTMLLIVLAPSWSLAAPDPTLAALNSINPDKLLAARTEILVKARNHDAAAQLQLGRMLFDGVGTGRDYKSAYNWLVWENRTADNPVSLVYQALAALEDGATPPFQRYGQRDRDFLLQKAVKTLQPLADGGDGQAVILLAKAAYAQGRLPGETSEAADKRITAQLLKAALLGDAVGQFMYGRMLQQDHGSTADAREWFLKSAVAGDTVAMMQLGLMEADEERARRWFLLADRLGSATADKKLRELYAASQAKLPESERQKPIVDALNQPKLDENRRAAVGLGLMLGAGAVVLGAGLDSDQLAYNTCLSANRERDESPYAMIRQGYRVPCTPPAK